MPSSVRIDCPASQPAPPRSYSDGGCGGGSSGPASSNSSPPMHRGVLGLPPASSQQGQPSPLLQSLRGMQQQFPSVSSLPPLPDYNKFNNNVASVTVGMGGQIGKNDNLNVTTSASKETAMGLCGGMQSAPMLCGGQSRIGTFGIGSSLANQGRHGINMTECVPVSSSEHVAEIVGRQGSKIKALRNKTNTYIKTPVRGEEPVFVVTGRREDVAAAKREILSAAEHFSQIRASRLNGMSCSSPGGSRPATALGVPEGTGQVTIQVRVPYRVVGLVVGPKGATIKRIQQDSQTYIVTPSRDRDPVFMVTGAAGSVERARHKIESYIALRTASEGSGGDPAGGEGTADEEGHMGAARLLLLGSFFDSPGGAGATAADSFNNAVNAGMFGGAGKCGMGQGVEGACPPDLLRHAGEKVGELDDAMLLEGPMERDAYFHATCPPPSLGGSSAFGRYYGSHDALQPLQACGNMTAFSSSGYPVGNNKGVGEGVATQGFSAANNNNNNDAAWPLSGEFDGYYGNHASKILDCNLSIDMHGGSSNMQHNSNMINGCGAALDKRAAVEFISHYGGGVVSSVPAMPPQNIYESYKTTADCEGFRSNGGKMASDVCSTTTGGSYGLPTLLSGGGNDIWSHLDSAAPSNNFSSLFLNNLTGAFSSSSCGGSQSRGADIASMFDASPWAVAGPLRAGLFDGPAGRPSSRTGSGGSLAHSPSASPTEAFPGGVGGEQCGGAFSSSESRGPSKSPPSGMAGGKRCFACNDGDVVAALVPCGHNSFCMDCAGAILSRAEERDRKCPICLQPAALTVRILS